MTISPVTARPFAALRSDFLEIAKISADNRNTKVSVVDATWITVMMEEDITVGVARWQAAFKGASGRLERGLVFNILAKRVSVGAVRPLLVFECVNHPNLADSQHFETGMPARRAWVQ
jgi:hypothetical protein